MADPADPVDLAAVAARLVAILEPYRDRLEASSIYGVASLKLPGVGAHNFFAGVKAGRQHVSFYLKLIYTWPRLLDGISPGLRKRMSGRTSFTFSTIDEGLLAELDALVARSFKVYQTRGAGPPDGRG